MSASKKSDGFEEFFGDWYTERRLGTGGCGYVTLWRNKKSQECVAIKKCHASFVDAAQEKQKERWCQEVDLMNNLISHVNIVRTVRVPDAFVSELLKTSPSNLPILIMEFCEGGDLRSLLNKAKNSIGLAEGEVRAILQSMRNAISYLHEMKITHRDIKPENIVITKLPNDRNCYKITDLGYAKNLDQKSIEASIVGTMEYFAPELLTNKYSSSVDYWSFGILAFEIMCGMRPFIPHSPLAQWWSHVSKKSSEHIYIYEDNNNKFNYMNTCPVENRCSPWLRNAMIKWLTLALEWNPKQRGYVFDVTPKSAITRQPSFKTKSVKFADQGDASVGAAAAEGTASPGTTSPPRQILKIFTTLDEILKQKVVSFFCMHTYKFIYIEVGAQMSWAELMGEIQDNLGYNKEEIFLILSLDHTLEWIEATTRPIDLYMDGFFERPMLYITRKKMIMSESVRPYVPTNVRLVLADGRTLLRPHTFRRLLTDVHFLIRNEQRLYETFLNGIYNFVLLLVDQITKSKPTLNKMNACVFGCKGALEVLSSSIQISEQNSVVVDSVKAKYARYLEDVNKCTDISTKISVRFDSALRRAREYLKASFFVQIEQDYMGVASMDKMYDRVRHRIYDKKVDLSLQRELWQYGYDCLKKRDQLLLCNDLGQLQRDICEVHLEMDRIQNIVRGTSEEADRNMSLIVRTNNELMQIVFISANQFRYRMSANGEYLPDMSEILNGNQPEFKIGGPVYNESTSMMDLDEFIDTDTHSILQENQNVLSQMAEFQQKFHSLHF